MTSYLLDLCHEYESTILSMTHHLALTTDDKKRSISSSDAVLEAMEDNELTSHHLNKSVALPSPDQSNEFFIEEIDTLVMQIPLTSEEEHLEEGSIESEVTVEETSGMIGVLHAVTNVGDNDSLLTDQNAHGVSIPLSKGKWCEKACLIVTK